MAEYIERESLKAEFMNHYASEYPAALVLAMIDNQPAADVAEVRHGKWYYNEMHSDLGYSTYVCSWCKKEVTIDEEDEKLNYCPHCGTQMDLE